MRDKQPPQFYRAPLAPGIQAAKTALEKIDVEVKEKLAQTPRLEPMPSVQEFCIETPLYKQFSHGYKIEPLELYKGTVDCQCLACGTHSVFQCDQNRHEQWPSAWALRFFVLRFNCTRKPEHRLIFMFRLEGVVIEKVGQYPSLASLSQPDLQKYREVLTEDLYAELNRGIGLATHGVGIGAFVYLRRIFEHLISKARSVAESEADWDESEYQKSRMDEKVRLLKMHLPPVLVEQSMLYSILSKGVHELTEEECLAVFPAVRNTVELILDDELASLRRKQKTEAAKNAIKAIAQGIKSR